MSTRDIRVPIGSLIVIIIAPAFLFAGLLTIRGSGCWGRGLFLVGVAAILIGGGLGSFEKRALKVAIPIGILIFVIGVLAWGFAAGC